MTLYHSIRNSRMTIAGKCMKKGVLLCGLMSAWLFASPIDAKPVDSSQWLKDDYVGVGAIDVPKLAQRRIYSYLMDFFVTDKNVKQAFSVIRSSGIVFEEILSRIVVGIPNDIDKAEHIILWETTQDLSQYKPLLSSFEKTIDKRMHQGMEYYATKRENECMAVLGSVLVLGSELKVKSILEAYKNGYAGGITNQTLQSLLKRANKASDAWFVFSLNKNQRAIIGRGDPLIDMTSTNEGVVRLGDLQSGIISLDFSKGLNTSATFIMSDDKAASQMTKAVSVLLDNGKKDPDIKALGIATFLTGIALNTSKSEVNVTVNFNQTTFDQLIALVTQFVKSMPGQPPKNAASNRSTETPPTQGAVESGSRSKTTNSATRPSHTGTDAKTRALQ